MAAEPYTKSISCPEHPQDSHTAVLYTFGHQYAGIWECPVSGASDSCEHESTHVEDVEYDVFEPVFGHDTRTTSIYVCDLCECQTDGDPAEDRAEAIADMQLMEALGK